MESLGSPGDAVINHQNGYHHNRKACFSQRKRQEGLGIPIDGVQGLRSKDEDTSSCHFADSVIVFLRPLFVLHFVMSRSFFFPQWRRRCRLSAVTAVVIAFVCFYFCFLLEFRHNDKPFITVPRTVPMLPGLIEAKKRRPRRRKKKKKKM